MNTTEILAVNIVENNFPSLHSKVFYNFLKTGPALNVFFELDPNLDALRETFNLEAIKKGSDVQFGHILNVTMPPLLH